MIHGFDSDAARLLRPRASNDPTTVLGDSLPGPARANMSPGAIMFLIARDPKRALYLSPGNGHTGIY
jgi:hypothetical protein